MATGCHGPVTARLFSVTPFPHSQHSQRCFENVRDVHSLRTYSPGPQVQEINLVLEEIYRKWWGWERGKQLSRNTRPLHMSSGPPYHNGHRHENGTETVRGPDQQISIFSIHPWFAFYHVFQRTWGQRDQISMLKQAQVDHYRFQHQLKGKMSCGWKHETFGPGVSARTSSGQNTLTESAAASTSDSEACGLPSVSLP